MTQNDFNQAVIDALDHIVDELRRGTRPHDWNDMVGLQTRIAHLRIHAVQVRLLHAAAAEGASPEGVTSKDLG